METGQRRMKRAKSIDELYSEVKYYDLVITNDAALATALNGRIDRPVVGYFAVTPRQLAGLLCAETLNQAMMDDLQVIAAIQDETGLDFRYIHGEVENIREIRRHTAEVYKHVHTVNARRVLASYEALPTLERVMSVFDPEKSRFFRERRKIAVIGPEFFDDLDKHFNPVDCDIIEVFADDDFVPDRAYQLGNDRQIAENAVDLIDPASAKDYAIIINSTAPMADAVRSALYRRGIPFVNALNVRDLAQIRDFIQFVTLSLQYDTLRVKHVKELFSTYNGKFRPKREEFLLSRQGPEDMSPQSAVLKNAMEHIRELTFDEVREIVCNKAAKIQVGVILEELGLSDRKVTPALVGDMTYAVDHVADLRHSEEIPESEKTGVLIADCTRSAYVDRPVVMYLGMEQDWNVTVVGKKYIDVEEESEINALRLSVLLQQGSSRIYCVNSTKAGKPARPCMSFDLLLGRPVTTFRDLFTEVIEGRWYAPSEVVTPETSSVEMEETYDKMFSKTSFNAYYSCPRKYMFNALLDTPDEKSSEFGNLIHEFAELYACYPQLVRDRGVDDFVTMISDRYSGLSSPLMQELDTEKIRKAMVNIMRFLDSRHLTGMPLDKSVASVPEYDRNRFMVELGLDFSSTACETDHRSVHSPMHGIFDLYRDGLVIDYKTGKAIPSAEIASKMTMGNVIDYPEFQPMIYLALNRELGGKGEFDMFYAMENDVLSEKEGFDIDLNVRRVRVVGDDAVEFMLDSGALEELMVAGGRNGLAKDYRDHYDDLVSMLAGSGLDPGQWPEDESLISSAMMIAGVRDNKSNRTTAANQLKKISSLVIRGLVTSGNYVDVSGECLNRFLDELGRMHDAAMEQSGTGFPALPLKSCERCQFRAVCTSENTTGEDGFDE